MNTKKEGKGKYATSTLMLGVIKGQRWCFLLFRGLLVSKTMSFFPPPELAPGILAASITEPSNLTRTEVWEEGGFSQTPGDGVFGGMAFCFSL